MTITYLILNVLFFITLVMFIPNTFKKPPKAWWVTLAGLFVLTAIFDPIMISLGFFEYTPSKIIGLTFFGAPIEDFFYAVYAATIIPLIWNRIGERKAEKDAARRK